MSEQILGRSSTKLIEKSNVIHTERVIIPENGFPDGLIVVCPRERVRTLADELKIRKMADGLLLGWIQDTDLPGVRYDYSQSIDVWTDLKDARRIAMASFVGWHFRGMQETLAVAYGVCVIGRVEEKLPTIVTCSADPGLLRSRWESDRPLIDALRKPMMIVRC